jgi:UDP-N-acetylglucosamine 2-epimerase (non-hydrolysing)
VLGTRPEAIKMAPVIKELSGNPAIKPMVCVTAQHRGMLDQVLELFEIRPEIDLDIMRDGQDLFHVIRRVLDGMREVLERVRPDMVLVQGDTSTAFGAALSAFYKQVPVGHVEAGLRTWDLHAPFPEEANRAMITRVAALHFAPTEKGKKNLLKENVREERIFVTGNTVIDALLSIREKIKGKGPVYWVHNFGEALIKPISDEERKIILVTGHRRENFGEGIENVCRAIGRIASSFKDVHIIYPVHPNPNVIDPVSEILGRFENVSLIRPLEYEPFVYLMDRAHFIITDSGGLQEEAPSLGKPVLVAREVTERPEAVEAGTAILVGTDPHRIFEKASMLLEDKEIYTKMARAHNLFGDGRASKRIAEVLLEYKCG